MKQLNDRERAVVKAYVNNGFNKTAAYQSVFPNCSYESATASGCQMLNQEHIKPAIAEETEKNISPLQDSKEAIVQEAIALTNESRTQKQFSAAMKGLDLRAKLGGYYDQDGEDATKYIAFIQQVTNNTQVNINKSPNKGKGSNGNGIVDKLEGVSLLNDTKVIDIDNPDDNDRYDEYMNENVPEVG